MTKTELSKFKKILESKQDELELIVRNRDAITIEKSADALDEVQHAAERELAIRNLDRESNLLRNVRSALRRIEDGSFGTCLHCEEEISPKRYRRGALGCLLYPVPGASRSQSRRRQRDVRRVARKRCLAGPPPKLSQINDGACGDPWSTRRFFFVFVFHFERPASFTLRNTESCQRLSRWP